MFFVNCSPSCLLPLHNNQSEFACSLRFCDHFHPPPPYWGNVTSSIDWCEENYLVTPFIAEFWNCFSSVFIAFVGLLHLLKYWRCGFEKSFLFASIALIVVGFGSAAFHGTLNFKYQMWDELPMMFGVLVWLYIAVNLQSPWKNRADYKAAGFVLLYAVAWSFLHSWFGFVRIFQIHFSFLVFVVQYVMLIQAFAQNDIIALYLLQLCVHLVDIVFWINAASQSTGFRDWERFLVLVLFIFFVTNLIVKFHALWHTGEALALHLTMTYLEVSRNRYLGKEPNVKWVFGVLPSYNRSPTHRKDD